MVHSTHPDLVLMDVLMPKLSGYEVCERIKHNPATRLTPVVLITALHEREHKIQGINAGADDFLTKPVDPHELRARAHSLVRLKRYTDDLDSAESVIMSLALVIEARDAYTDGHCQRLAAYATVVRHGAQPARRRARRAVPRRISARHRQGRYSGCDSAEGGPPERQRVPSRSRAIPSSAIGSAASCGRCVQVRSIVRHHHERLDGSGYPDGLKGDDIPLLAQIMGIVDVYDAITTERPYKSAGTAAEAHEELLREVDRGWRRKDLVETFISLKIEPSLAEAAHRDD